MKKVRGMKLVSPEAGHGKQVWIRATLKRWEDARGVFIVDIPGLQGVAEEGIQACSVDGDDVYEPARPTSGPGRSGRGKEQT